MPQTSRSARVVACLLIGALCGAIAKCHGQQQATKPKQAEDLLDSKLVNLNDILIHQQALKDQCKQLQLAKLEELRQVIEFGRELGAELQLGERLTIRLPAICLMLVGPPQIDGKPSQESGSNRLDLVNWIYEPDFLIQEAAGAQNKTTKKKRQASSVFAQNAAQNSAGLLNDYWLDLNKLDGSSSSTGNQLESGKSDDEMANFHEQVGRMLDDDRFKEAIKQAADSNQIAAYLSPVILVPGLAGSRLQARLVAKKPKVNIICSRSTGWQDIWLTLRSFLPVAVDCWIDNVRMEFDPTTGFTRDSAGIESRVPDFGSVESVRHLDLKSPTLTRYFHAIIERYEQLGYLPDKNLFAAPYDFRLAPQQLEQSFFTPLKQLIEFAHTNGGRESLSGGGGGENEEIGAAGVSGRLASAQQAASGHKVTLVCHSMGCTHLLIFLRNQTAAWRQSRIRKLIALSSPWGGTVKALKALLVGEQFGLPLVSELKMRKLARTFPGVAYMMPQAQIFERPSKNEADFGNQVLVQTSERSYRVSEMEALLKAAGMERQWAWFEQAAVNLIKPLEPLPDLSVDCLHSLNIPTPETIVFKNATDFPDGNYELVQGDGDGTVNHQSLLVCGLWASQLPNKVRHKIVMNTNHVGVLSHKSTLEHITDDVLANN